MVMGIWITWRVPAADSETARLRHDHAARLLLSLALVADWLLFVMDASALGWTPLILGAIPVATLVLGQSISMVMLGLWPDAATPICAPVVGTACGTAMQRTVRPGPAFR